MNAASAPRWVGFDLGGTKMLATVYDEKFQPLGRKRKKTKGYEGAEAGIDRIIATLEEAVSDAKVRVEDICGIGIGCPGPVDSRRGVVVEAVNLSWRNVKVGEILKARTGAPTFVVNDVDAGVFGENQFGAAVGARTVVGMFPGTGIGGGCVYAGEILRGKATSAMEIGHVRVVENGPLCGCGQQGCLETVASRLAIAAEVAKAAYRGEAPSVLEAIHTEVADIRSGVLAKAVKDGEKAVERIIKTAAYHMGVALANVVSLLVPDVIVLGGGLVEAMPKLILGEVESSLKKNVMPAFASSYRLTAAKLQDDSTVLGAAAWAARNVADQKK